jgi:hypothetical protein
MLKSLSCAAALMLAAPFASADDARLTDTETRWIAAGMSVVRYARSVDLPVDIVVQPGNQPDASPIAIGIKDGRCKLVLSMRGNPGSTALVASVPPAYFDAVVGAVFAHEIGHCWRYVQGEWNALPSGFAPPVGTGEAAQKAALGESRREEGYADLVGLAWTRRAHPQHYGEVRNWLERFRADALPGEHHDTAAWLRQAPEPSSFEPSVSLFQQAKLLWEREVRGRD